MPDKLYDYVLSVGDQITWYCTFRKRGLRRNSTHVLLMGPVIRFCQEGGCTNTTDMKEELKQLQKRREEDDIILKEELRKEQEEKLRELKDEEAQRNNIIIYGVPESNEKEGARQRVYDLRFTLKLILKTLEIEIQQSSLKKLIRLGKIENKAERPRPLLVGFDSPSTKQQVLIHTKKLKGKEIIKAYFCNATSRVYRGKI
ncbi:hypothetical protein SK128_006970 [Halocaridina rubra]|uniref:Uncharacterized protein n=1 Tax=Halocaridina rubra TaxID=373956 RepID=A0AAN9A499_HALRR